MFQMLYYYLGMAAGDGMHPLHRFQIEGYAIMEYKKFCEGEGKGFVQVIFAKRICNIRV
jgi:hypothetical protein